MLLRVKTPLVAAFGTFREGEVMTVSDQEAVGFLNAGLAETVKEEPSTAVKNKNTERATRAGGRA